MPEKGIYMYFETNIFKGSQRNYTASPNCSGDVNSTVATLKFSCNFAVKSLHS